MREEVHKDLAKHRLDTAKACIEEADLLLQGEKYRAAVSRLYYAVFHGMRAVLALEKTDFKKHSAVIGYFRQNYIKPGIFSAELSPTITALFDARAKSDYDDWYLIDKAATTVYFAKAQEFVQAVEAYIEER